MATRGDSVQAAQETARLGISTEVEGVATGIIDIGAATPVVAPLCLALLKVKGIVDGASRNKEELKKLCERCAMITGQVIVKAKASNTSTIDVSPLQECIDKLEELAERYHDQGRLARLARFRRDGDDIQRLRARIEAVVPIMGLAVVVTIAEGVANVGDQVEAVRQNLARLQPRPKLAPVPKEQPPRTESWHTVRDGVVDRVVEILGGDGGPAVAALTGWSGAGKTTAAAAMVNERGLIHPRPGETKDQARTRLEGVRALFADGVVWLRVGRREGAAERLPSLMLTLANAVHENVMGKRVDPPALGESGESYVKKIVSQEKLRCLVVADDVWHAEVVEKLRKTGMWVLLTTREPSMVKPNERTAVNKLTSKEAEDVLRGAAGLPHDERLCDGAKDVLKICDFVAMDIAFVGRWNSVCAATGIPKSSQAWARTAGEIKGARAQVRNACGMDELDVNRLAVLRTGFKHLGNEDPVVHELYVALAVFPDGHAFGESDAAVLLGDGEVTKGPISILERWGVLQTDTSGRYRMHDAHVDFARDKLMGWKDVRKPAVQRWTTHVSRLDVAIGFDLYTLLDMWHVLEGMQGEGCWTSRRYDDQLVRMDVSDPSKSHAVNFVAEIYNHDQKFVELETLMQRVLKQCDDHGGDNPTVEMIALFHTRRSLFSQGRFQELEDLTRRLGEMVGPSFQVQESDCGTGFAHASTAFHFCGVCAMAAGRPKDAEEWFRKALKVEDDGGRTASSRVVSTLHELGRCMQEAGRLEEAEQLFKRALEIKEAKLGADHLNVAWTLDGMGLCALQAGRLQEAEQLLKTALEIKKTKLGADDMDLAATLHSMGLCVRQAWRLGEAEKLLKRALKIKEARLVADDVDLALTLDEIGRCVREAGRPGEAEEFFTRALEIFKAKLGADDPQFAWTLNELGVCARQAGRPREAEELFKRALEIFETKL